jgi:segregation and condensation protein A
MRACNPNRMPPSVTADSLPVLHAPKRLVLPVFEGPLDLLLHLVKVHEMDIYDIEISEITRQYLEYLGAMAELNLEVAGDFLVMAATLLNIKSRSMLPRQEEEQALGEEEEIDAILSTQDLIRRLVEYRKFKDISSNLSDLEARNSGVYYRAQMVSLIPGREDELPRQDIRALYDAFVVVLKQVRLRPSHTVVRERFTVEEKLFEVRELLRRERHVNFARVFERCVDKEEAICYFLALLELSRLREITIAQAETYGDILIAPWDENVGYVG